MLEIWFATQGRNVTDFVVKLEAFVDGEYREVVRFDSGHDHPHRDTLDWAGTTIRKRWERTGITFNQALDEAISDIQVNWERYIEDYLRNRP
jgi:hypothetical protein